MKKKRKRETESGREEEGGKQRGMKGQGEREK